MVSIFFYYFSAALAELIEPEILMMVFYLSFTLAFVVAVIGTIFSGLDRLKHESVFALFTSEFFQLHIIITLFSI